MVSQGIKREDFTPSRYFGSPFKQATSYLSPKIGHHTTSMWWIRRQVVRIVPLGRDMVWPTVRPKLRGKQLPLQKQRNLKEISCRIWVRLLTSIRARIHYHRWKGVKTRCSREVSHSRFGKPKRILSVAFCGSKGYETTVRALRSENNR